MRLNNMLILALTLLLFLGGCWDVSKSPLVKNCSGGAITLILIFDDHEEDFKIEDNDSLLFPDLLKDDAVRSIKVISEDLEFIGLKKQEMIDFMKQKYKYFIINKGLFVLPQKHASECE